MQGSPTLSELAVPIMVKGHVIGVLDIQSDRLEAFDSTDVAVAQALANQAGTAVENARLYARAQRSAVAEERNRLARELHDAVTQTLFSASLIAEAVPATWGIDQEEGKQLLRELQQLTRGALAEMRTLLLELRPAALMEAELSELVRQLAVAAAGREGLPIDVHIDGRCTVPPEVHVALYRIAQEALNNTVKHSRAQRVEVRLVCSEPSDVRNRARRVRLEVRDDGRGFRSSDVAADHLGLSIMRERAEAVGATLQVRTAPGEGTDVVVTWSEELPET
jgi:signal transduction histidine kinase